MQTKPFRIGLCMAGAVSAGAYTAGVMDYLLEALAEWEKRRGLPEIPSHHVTIPIMGGASAGGMTALLTATMVNNALVPVALPAEGKLLDEHPENKLYHSWVDLTGKDMFPKMLDASDIKKGEIVSLLNSDFIDAIAEKMIGANADSWLPTPPWFEMPVKIFTTLSNLEGFAYNVDFNARRQKEKYNMSVHNDYACFALNDGAASGIEKGWIPLNFRTGQNLKTAKDAAMGTGAFPVGLKSRVLERDASDVNAIPWLQSVFNKSPLPDGIVKTLNVDGGMINNEPFEKVRDLLDDITLKDRKLDFTSMEQKQDFLNAHNSNYNTFDNTVLLIDPFPSTAGDAFKFDQGLFSIIGKTLSAMTAQMRAKPVNYQSAMQMADASQYIISPAREIRNNDGMVTEELFGEKAIACGTLGGFGGFLSKEFRIHDYYLGRYNCEIFLRDYFTVPEEALTENPIFAEGYKGVATGEFSSIATGSRRIQIIPIFTPRNTDFPMPRFSSKTTWPSVSVDTIDKFGKPLRERIQKITLNAADLGKFTNVLLWIGAKVVLNKMLGNKVLDAIKNSLKDWNLLRK